MRFHSNQLSWVINYPFISLCFKYHSPGFICFSTMLAPVISSLDEIYCSFWPQHIKTQPTLSPITNPVPNPNPKTIPNHNSNPIPTRNPLKKSWNQKTSYNHSFIPIYVPNCKSPSSLTGSLSLPKLRSQPQSPNIWSYRIPLSYLQIHVHTNVSNCIQIDNNV